MPVAGIDVGIRKVAIAILNGEDHRVYTFESPKMDRAAELVGICDFVANAVSFHGVERTFIEKSLVGNNRDYSLSLAQVVGAILYRLRISHHVREIQLVSVGEWKKSVTGRGDTNKVAVRTWVDAHYPAYAVHCDGDQDAYDATCIAIYGRDLLARSERLMADPGLISQ